MWPPQQWSIQCYYPRWRFSVHNKNKYTLLSKTYEANISENGIPNMCFTSTLKFYFILLYFFFKNMLVTGHLILSWPASGQQPMVHKQQQQNSPNKQVYHLRSRAETKSSIGVFCAFGVDQISSPRSGNRGDFLVYSYLQLPVEGRRFLQFSISLPLSRISFFLPRILESHYKLVSLQVGEEGMWWVEMYL